MRRIYGDFTNISRVNVVLLLLLSQICACSSSILSFYVVLEK